MPSIGSKPRSILISGLISGTISRLGLVVGLSFATLAIALLVGCGGGGDPVQLGFQLLAPQKPLNVGAKDYVSVRKCAQSNPQYGCVKSETITNAKFVSDNEGVVQIVNPDPQGFATLQAVAPGKAHITASATVSGAVESAGADVEVRVPGGVPQG